MIIMNVIVIIIVRDVICVVNATTIFIAWRLSCLQFLDQRKEPVDLIRKYTGNIRKKNGR